eukprot:07890.XXX_346272_342114_1 [CDS] Oithona nana genome sequencing.
MASNFPRKTDHYRFYTTPSVPPYNLLDHPEMFMMSNGNNQLPPDVEARNILDSYSNSNMFGQQRQHSRGTYGAMDPCYSSEQGMPPPYPERNITNESTSESQALLPDLPRRNSFDSDSGTRFEETELKIGSAVFFSVAAGILFAGCRLLFENVRMNAIEVTLVGSLVQILISGLFVSFCQCKRLWPGLEARNNHKLFLVLFAFLYGIEALCQIVIYDDLNQFDAEALSALLIISTPIMSLVIYKEPLKIWKLLFIPLMLLSLAVIIRPPIIFSSQLTPDSDPVRYGNVTVGMLAGIVGVTLIGGLSNVSIAVTGPFVHNGILIFYGGFASFLVGVLASRADSTQKILTPDIVQIPFINWMLMISYSLMNVTGLTFFMKSVKFSTPTIAVCMTKMTYILILYTAYCILQQHIPDTLAVIGLVVLLVSSICLCLEFSISRRLPRLLQRCF